MGLLSFERFSGSLQLNKVNDAQLDRLAIHPDGGTSCWCFACKGTRAKEENAKGALVPSESVKGQVKGLYD